jgi:two-component system cell cycle sensor histidine kinase/response regulator CckA
VKHHVLVLDDEAEVRAAIRLQLKGTRFEILEAETAQQAIELLSDNAISVDVIICDVRMPGISGVEAVEQFQREYDFMKKQDVVDYLTKPVEKQKLVATVEKAAQERKLFE